MAIKIKDKNGNVIQVAGVGKPGTPGQNGTSAYQAAVAGGYTGTEEDFNERMAKGVFVGTGTALATGWTGQQNTVTITGLPAPVTGIVGVSGSAGDDAWQAAVAAVLRPVSQAAGSVTIKALGTPPDVDIPISIYYWPDTGSPVLLSMFPGTGEQIPLDAPTGFTGTAGNAQVTLTWTDPKDKYATPEGETTEEGDQLVSEWDYTRIIRKTGSAPTGPNDGVLVVESSVRDQYASTGYVDSGLTNGTTYYYGAYAYNKDGVASEGAVTEGLTPKNYQPVLADNSWEDIIEAANAGKAQELWQVGDEKDLTVGDETLTAVIMDFNHDDLADGSGKATITFGLKNLMANKTVSGAASGSSSSLLFNNSSLCSYLNNTVFSQLDSALQSGIKTVNKSTAYYSTYGSLDTYNTGELAAVKLFTFSTYEIMGFPTAIDQGPSPAETDSRYPYFSTAQNRIKKLANGAGEASIWFSRMGCIYSSYGQVFGYYGVTETGSYTTTAHGFSAGICFGFCI